jgi:ubiquinone/menaquinone biosynthesis C-methylase UbiE
MTFHLELRQRRSRLLGLSLLAAVLLTAGCTAFKRYVYEVFGRDGWQQPEKVVQSLALRQGERIADLGSGGGYFTFRFSQAVGPAGKVYAVDVDREMLDYVGARAKEDGHPNIETVAARYDDPLLPESGVDLIFTSNVYHHIASRVKYFAGAAKYLRPGGRIAIVDFDGRHWSATFIGHYTPVEVIKKEMGEAGYRLEREFDFLDRQSFLVFSRKAQ